MKLKQKIFSDLVNLVWIVLVCWHESHVVEDDLHRRAAEVRPHASRGQLLVKTSHEPTSRVNQEQKNCQLSTVLSRL